MRRAALAILLLILTPALAAIIILAPAISLPISIGISAMGIPAAIIATAVILRVRYDRLPEQRRAAITARLQRPGMSSLGLLAMGLLMMLFSMAWGSAFQDGSILIRALDASTLLAFWVASAIAMVGIRRTAGGRYCRKCCYEMSDSIASDPDATCCPECGHLWKGIFGTVTGKVERRWGWITLGIAVGALLVLWPVLCMSAPSLRQVPLRALPTASLVTEVISGRGPYADEAWTVLTERPLSPAQRQQLAEGLLNSRQARRYLRGEADTWLQQQVVTARLPAELSQRYITEHPCPELLPLRMGRRAGTTGASH